MAMAVYQARVAITTTGTRQTLASAQDVDWVLLWCPLSNEQAIKIGSATVTDTNATTEGLPIIPGAPPIQLGACDLNDINVVGFAKDKIYYFGSEGQVFHTS